MQPGGAVLQVEQLQTLEWADLTAPDDTKTMRDLIHKAMELNTSVKGKILTQLIFSISPQDPVLVHCSAGVGRSGTFIAVYKLLEDYLNKDRKQLDVFGTVLEMRGQRMRMIQKAPQYVYVFKCLRAEVKDEEGGYYS